MRYHFSFSRRLFPPHRSAARGIGNGFTASNCRCEEGALGEIYGNGATPVLAHEMCEYIHVIPVHGICAHADLYRACRKPLNLAADSHEIIGREMHLGNFQ